MKVVIAIDSFKGSLSSLEAGDAIKQGILRVYKDASVVVRPLADGGEGTASALTEGMGGKWVDVTVTGPLGDKVKAGYGMIESSGTAIMEMSAAAGITQVPAAKRNPMHTTTYGVGEMIVSAIRNGCRKFIVGIGGSATNDGGIGMLQALGYEFLNKDGKPVGYGAQGVSEIVSIKTDKVLPELAQCSFKIACDVNNPLCGEKGCSAIFGPQKGATEQMVKDMDGYLKAYGELTQKTFSKADMTYPGTGAAGGLGFAFLSYTNAVLQSGIHIVLEETRLDDYVKDADIVITGEGRLDAQTVMGKAPVGVAEVAKKHGKKVLAFSGCVTKDATACNEAGIDAFFPILRAVVSLDEAMDADNARANMADTVEQVFRTIKSFS